MCMRSIIIFISVLILAGCDQTQPVSFSPKGKLFIIGGGDRTPLLMNELKRVAQLTAGSTIAVLPMAGEEPDSSFFYFQKDIPVSWKVKCLNLNFSDTLADIALLKAQLQKAQTVFICGGDQKRFMDVVEQYGLSSIIKDIYLKGATIAGTSAGAAVMSEKMITGDQTSDTAYSATYSTIQPDNGIYANGLGFITKGIVDQHFIVRSRYNRLFSAQLDFPQLWAMGIDESTAAVFHNDSVEVVGLSYVVYFSPIEQASKDTMPHLTSTTTFYRPGEKFRLAP